MEFHLFLLPNTVKVFDDAREMPKKYESATALTGDRFSLQAVFFCGEAYHPVSLFVSCPTAFVSVSRVDPVPVPSGTWGEKLDHTSFPDLLRPRSPEPEWVKTEDAHLPYYEKGEKTLLCASPSARAVWITLGSAEKGLGSGTHLLRVAARSLKTGETLAEETFSLRVFPVKTAEKTYLYTNWFHYDCLADFYQLPIWSRAYFRVLKRYLTEAVQHGQTMILFPALTPALDTPQGGERKCVQLVGISVEKGRYTFDFSRLEAFIRLCRKCGFRYFEHPHLFTQWGAAHAPAIYGAAEGKRIRLFGWETDASSPEYRSFLEAYLPALLEKAREWGVEKDLFFHISDEPRAEHEESYRRAVSFVRPLLRDCRCGDALSDFRFYENGSVSIPIVGERRADDFYGKCGEMLLYHTGHPNWPGSRRLITSSYGEIRSLGWHLFYYRAIGYLHWGYNYWYGAMSHGIFDPKCDPCGYKNIAGASFLVYPGENGVPLSSVRGELMREAFGDYRALLRLEKALGYDACLKLCRSVTGKTPRADVLFSGEEILALREEVNKALAKAVKAE